MPALSRRPTAAAALAVALLASPSWTAAQDLPAAGSFAVVTPVELMPPVNRDAYIRAIRQELAVHGYDAGPAGDAVLDGRLAAAIARYQSDAGLAVDGVASKELLDHLKFVLPKVYAARALRPGELAAIPLRPRAAEPEPGTGRAYWPDEVTTEILPDLPDLPETAPLEIVPGPGATAPAAPPAPGGVVSQVQRALKQRGYFAGPVDGVFSPATGAAVRRFQQDNGLPTTGVIDSDLLAVLTSAWQDPRTSHSATPAESGAGGVNL